MLTAPTATGGSTRPSQSGRPSRGTLVLLHPSQTHTEPERRRLPRLRPEAASALPPTPGTRLQRPSWDNCLLSSHATRAGSARDRRLRNASYGTPQRRASTRSGTSPTRLSPTSSASLAVITP